MHAPARLASHGAACTLSEAQPSCVARARAARVSAPRRCCASAGRAVVAPRAAHVRSARSATRVAPPPPAAARVARRRVALPAPCAAGALDAALPYDVVFGSAAAVVAESRALPGGASLLLLRSRTARVADSVSGDDNEAEPGDELQLFAMDESVAEAAASMGVDAASAAAALLECQWATVLAQHASATSAAAGSPKPLASVAGIAVAVGELAAAETARLRAADAAFRTGLEAQLAQLGTPPGLAATSAAAGGAAWLSRLESALDLAECVEQDAVTWPGAAAVLLPGTAAEDAALLNALNALLPRAAAAAAEADGDSEETVAPDAAGALALAPWLEGACDRGLAAAARALGVEAHRRVAANEWRMAARFAAAEEGSAPRAPLLVLLLPVGAGGDVAPEHAAIAARVAAARAKAKLPPPLLAAWGEPAAQAQGGDALRARRDTLVRAAADAVADALGKAV